MICWLLCGIGPSAAVGADMAMQECFRRCPKCGYVLPQAMPASAQCPACGIYFFKWGQEPHQAPDEHLADAAPGLLHRLLQPKAELDAPSFHGRCIALVLLAYWNWHLIRDDYHDGEIFDSFMHSILLPIHEAGHILFIPFGEFMTILGGSLLQLTLPCFIVVAFVVRNRDNFAAALGLWWTGVSLLDLSPYIYDSLHPQLTMLGGHTGEDGPHDWIYLLGTVGQIPQAQHWGALGAVMSVLALLWGVAILIRQRQDGWHDQI